MTLKQAYSGRCHVRCQNSDTQRYMCVHTVYVYVCMYIHMYMYAYKYMYIIHIHTRMHKNKYGATDLFMTTKE